MGLRETILLAVVFAATGLKVAVGGPVGSSEVTIVHTAGLGNILTGVRGVDRPTSQALMGKLAELRAKYKDALFVDGGDALGPMVIKDTEFGLPTYRVFDANRYAAAALSARDGLHTTSFLRHLPLKAKPATPLVGLFDRRGFPEHREIPLQPTSVTAQCSGLKFHIFGVATTSGLTGIYDPPLLTVRVPGDASKSADFLLANMAADCIPIILSDMTATENDVLAKRLARNALVFEAGYPWRLAQVPAGQTRDRRVGPVRIISHFSPGDADVVALPASGQCSEAQVRSETLWTPKASAPSGGLSRILGREPLEARVARTWFTDTFILPDIGMMLGEQWRELIEMTRIPCDIAKTQRVPPENDPQWKAPKWMNESRHLRGNEIVYRYSLFFNERQTARVYRIHHLFVPNYTVVELLVAVDEKHRIDRIVVASPVMITHRQVRLQSVMDRLKGKGSGDLRIEDWPERAGVEFLVDNLVRDVQMLLAWDEEAG